MFSNSQITWKPYKFSSLHVALANLVVIYSGITEDDHLKYKNKTKSKRENFIEYIKVSTDASQLLEVWAAVSIFYNGLSDYAEAEGETYKETCNFNEWGTGEEGSSFLGWQSVSYEPRPSCLGFIQKNTSYLLQALENPDWQDVPYIRLIANGGSLPT